VAVAVALLPVVVVLLVFLWSLLAPIAVLSPPPVSTEIVFTDVR
jgi:hypothetical protein